MTFINRARQWARAIKRDVHALYLSARDPRTPLMAKIVAVLVAAYALSPIDLIPDFIPVLGYLDDLLIVPLGIMLAVWLVPADILAEHRATAATAQSRPVSKIAAVFVVVIWVLLAAVLFVVAKNHLMP